MARPLDSITKDPTGLIRVGGPGGVVLFRVVNTGAGKVVHIRLKANCRSVILRGDPDYYIPWDEFKREVDREDT